MKRCPQCNRVETDEALKFCRADGIALIIESSSIDSDAGTIRLGSSLSSGSDTSVVPSPSAVPAINRSTGPTTVLSVTQTPGTTRELSKPKRRGLVFAAIALVGVGVAIAGYLYVSRKNGGATIQSIAVMPFVN